MAMRCRECTAVKLKFLGYTHYTLAILWSFITFSTDKVRRTIVVLYYFHDVVLPKIAAMHLNMLKVMYKILLF